MAKALPSCEAQVVERDDQPMCAWCGESHDLDACRDPEWLAANPDTCFQCDAVLVNGECPKRCADLFDKRSRFWPFT
jgi:hypothetical protein